MKTKIILLVFTACFLFSCSSKDDDVKKGSDWTVKLSVYNYEQDCSFIIFSSLVDNVVLSEKKSQIPSKEVSVVLPNYEFSGNGKHLVIMTAGGTCVDAELQLNFVIEIFENGVLLDTT